MPRLARKRKANANDWGRFSVSVAAYNTPYSNYLGAEGLLNKMLNKDAWRFKLVLTPV